MREQPIPTLPDALRANLTGIRRLWLFRADSVLSIKDPARAPQYQFSEFMLPVGALELQEGSTVIAWQLRPKWASFTEASSEPEQGLKFKQIVSVSLPRDNPQTAMALQLMVTADWILGYQDSNGYLKLIGTQKQPCRLELQTSVGSSNSYALNWTTETTRKAPFLSDADAMVFQAYLSDSTFLDFTL